MDNRIFQFGAVVGFLIMVATFVAYVFDPERSYELMFIIGLVLMVLGYVISYLENRKALEEYYDVTDEAYISVLCDDYVPFTDDTVIEDLTEE